MSDLQQATIHDIIAELRARGYRVDLIGLSGGEVNFKATRNSSTGNISMKRKLRNNK